METKEIKETKKVSEVVEDIKRTENTEHSKKMEEAKRIEKTEEQKRQEALARDLDSDQRQKVFDEFSNNWDDICQKITNSVNQSIRNNYSLKQSIQSQSKATIEAYVNDCIKQMRLMVE